MDLPHDKENEVAVLGSIMINPGSIEEVADILTKESFFDLRHQIIYAGLLHLFNNGKEIDMLTLKTFLEGKDYLQKAGGVSYIASLTTNSSVFIKNYADVVKKKEIMRNTIIAGNKVAKIGSDNKLAVEDIIEQSEKEVLQISRLVTENNFIALKQSLKNFSLDREKLSGGVPTGYPKLDAILSGFQKSDLIILAGRPSMGKTTLAFDFIRNIAVKHNIPVGIFSLEMATEQLQERLISAQSGVDAWKIKTRTVNSEEEKKIVNEAKEILSKAPIFIDDDPNKKLVSIRSGARKLKKEHGIKLLVIDYLQLIQPSRGSDSTVQQVTEISRGLKLIARELEMPIIALSQLSRAVEQRGGNPRLSDLRDSGSIEQDADVVMFIHNKTKYTLEPTDETDLLIKKHRNGALGKVPLMFKPKQTTFVETEFKGYDGI